VFIFPSLGAGNIGYTIAERIGSAAIIGPILRGLAKTANDLSRGCDAQDVLNAITITTRQSN
jgi:phosphate acetyltransferase